MCGDKLLPAKSANESLQRPNRRRMKMRFGFFQRNNRRTARPRFEKGCEQRQHCKALCTLAMVPHGNLRTTDSPQVDPRIGEHVEHPAWNRFNRHNVTRRERNDVLYLAKTLVYPSEAVVRAYDKVVHLADRLFNLRLFLHRKLGVFQKRPPKRSPFSEVVPSIPQRMQIIVRDLLLETSKSSISHRGQRLTVQIQERPLRIKARVCRVVLTSHAQDYMTALVVVYLNNTDTVEATNKLGVPFALGSFGKRDLDQDGVRRCGFRRTIRQVEVKRIEDGSPTRSDIFEAYPHSI